MHDGGWQGSCYKAQLDRARLLLFVNYTPMGIDVIMFTGDSIETGDAVAKKLGIKQVMSEVAIESAGITLLKAIFLV